MPRPAQLVRRTLLWAASCLLSWQGAHAIDLDEPGLQSAAASLPSPRDHFAPVHGKPSFLSADEWAGVQASAQASSKPAQEAARQVDYLRFQKTYFQWSEAKSSQPKQARVWAHQLLKALPDKVAQGVVGAEQAEQIQAQLVTYLEPDPARSKRLLEREHRRLPPQPSAPPAFAH